MGYKKQIATITCVPNDQRVIKRAFSIITQYFTWVFVKFVTLSIAYEMQKVVYISKEKLCWIKNLAKEEYNKNFCCWKQEEVADVEMMDIKDSREHNNFLDSELQAGLSPLTNSLDNSRFQTNVSILL